MTVHVKTALTTAAPFELGTARQQGMLNIGEAAKASGVSAKMIRHYESIGLVAEAKRTDAGYRLYSSRDVQVLQFIHRGRELGFTLEQIGTLLALWRDKGRASKDVRAMAQEHIAELDRKIREMQAMQRTLVQLATACHGDERPECPILDDLALAPPSCHS